DGAVDEVALYDRVLSRETLGTHFAALMRPASKDEEISLMLTNQAPLFQVSRELAEGHADAYTNEWQHTSPDLVVFIPEAKTGPQTDNQHFIVFPLENGDFFALWTSAYRESHPNQHIVFSKSRDRGITWSKPVTIAGPKVIEKDGKTAYEGLASWGFPIYVPDKNRIYVFYQKGIGVYDPRPGFTGEMRFIYTEDDGETWSREYTVPMRRTAIMNPDPRVPPNWIIWQKPVEITPGQIIGCGTIWASEQLGKQDAKALIGSECWFWRFDNVFTEDDPTKIRVTMLPDGDHGIRMPNSEGSRVSTAEEPTVVRLSDGRWFCVFRTFRGCIGYSISTDEGHTWSEARPLLYRDGGERMLQPTASCPLYPLGDGRFLLPFHNNDGTANGGKDPWDWRRNRTPAFYSIGREMLDRDQPVWFTRPIMFLDNEAKPWGPIGRVSVAVYTSFFEFEGRRYYWYPDRKHFLLGKFITDEMLKRAERVDE
ncbi:MAG: sialidase family protein, partial [Armatimonadota bacterium]